MFQGGKIKGITRRLDYIKNLGCNAIWISPPFKNRMEYNDSCHGYAIQDFLAVDPRLGTLEDLQEMVREAHKRGMYVILDIVINHTGNNWIYANGQDQPPFLPFPSFYPKGPWRPFCSERCKMVDLGAWVLGHYRIPGKTDPDEGVPPAPLAPAPARWCTRRHPRASPSPRPARTSSASISSS